MYRKLHISKKSSTFAAAFEGKLSEWSKEPHSKCGVHIALYRGFESLTFRRRKARETEWWERSRDVSLYSFFVGSRLRWELACISELLPTKKKTAKFFFLITRLLEFFVCKDAPGKVWAFEVASLAQRTRSVPSNPSLSPLDPSPLSPRIPPLSLRNPSPLSSPRFLFKFRAMFFS